MIESKLNATHKRIMLCLNYWNNGRFLLATFRLDTQREVQNEENHSSSSSLVPVWLRVHHAPDLG